MLHRYLNVGAYATLLLTLLCTSVRAQTVVSIMDFEGGTPEMTVSMDATSFYDGGSSRFYGIHNGNGATGDGSPDDTGVANTGRVANVSAAPIGGDVLFVNDLNDTPVGGTAGFAEITFGPVDVSATTTPFFTFDYNIFGFDNGDDVEYYLIEDGVDQATVVLMDGASNASDAGRVTVPVTSSTMSVSLVLRVKQNGTGDYAAFDNFQVTDGMPAAPCTIGSFGPVGATTCLAETSPDNTDAVSITIPYSGSDAGVSVELDVNGTTVGGFTNDGDDPTAVADGELVLSAATLIEGSSYEVRLVGSCSFMVTGTVAADACEATCDLSTDISMLRLLCGSLSDGTDPVIGSLDYDGIEPGATASIAPSGFISNPGNPGTEAGGEINFAGLVEGGSYTITISGGDCTGAEERTISFSVPADFCTESDLVVNEVLANPTGGIDVNMDGSTNSDDEFIELYNNGAAAIDISGYVIEEFAGPRHTFAPGTVVEPGNGIMVIANAGVAAGIPTLDPDSYGCEWVEAEVTFIGLNNTGTDGVIVRDAAGSIVAQMTYTGTIAGESLALSPDGNLAGGYQNHTDISSTGAQSSPCGENINNEVGLPVELLSFGAEAKEKSVLLTWSTANEIDNDRFFIERRSLDRQWQTIGAISAGSSTENSYEFSDEYPLNGNNYYRLRQLDYNGESSLYGPVMAVFTAEKFLVFPNPATAEIHFGGTFSTTDRISLHDANGRMLSQVTPGADRVDLTDLKQGVYLLRVANDKGLETIRFVKK